MGRQKKSEIDAILEQLKISYFDDSLNDQEESLQETVEFEEDAELSAVLAKIFSESESIEKDNFNAAEQPVESQESDEPSDQEEPSLYVDDGEATEEVVNVAAEPKEEPLADKNIDTSENIAVQGVVTESEHIKSEQEIVDDVLKSMFHSELISQTNSDTIESSEQDDTYDFYDNQPDLPDDSKLTSDPSDELINDNAEPICIELENSTTEGSEISQSLELEEEASGVETDNDEFYYSDENESTDTTYVITRKKIIVDPDDYVRDDMQRSLLEIPFFKPQTDIDFSIREYVEENDSKTEETETVGLTSSDPKSEMSDKEISLLIKLGYTGEINASGENQHANKVIFNKSKDYIPEKHKIIHGFCGKEFSSKDQISDIKKKFKFDSIRILVQSIIVSLIAVVMVAYDLSAVFSDVKHNSIASLCLLSSLIVSLVMSKQIFAGISAIIKFDTNQYSLPSVILIESIICHIIICFILLAQPDLISPEAYFSVGGYPILYMAITAWSEWIDCYRESGIFNFIAHDGTRYVAEQQTSANVIKESIRRRAIFSDESENRYIIRRAGFISGFHKKTCEGKPMKSKIFLSIGIIPAIAIIMGIIISVFNDSIVHGLSGMTFVLFLSAPVFSVASLSVIELLNYFRLKKTNSVLIGSDTPSSISKTRSLVFQDVDAIRITACTKINPNKNTENPQKWLNIAKSVFETLGGPLSKIHTQDKDKQSNIDHDVAINSISDNGIDLYFDSSMNVLIGDRAYMQSHNIKVKTDVNLTGATHGTERSVIYMAFDKTPQIGFIVTSKVKKSFLKIIYLLTNSNINIEVQSYEPQINDYFFEINNPDSPVSVVKPLKYESSEPSDVSDSCLVSSSPLDMCRTIIYSKIMARDINKIKRSSGIQSIVGLLASIVLGALLCMPDNIIFVGVLRELSVILFYLIALAMMIPGIIHIVKVLKRK